MILNNTSIIINNVTKVKNNSYNYILSNTIVKGDFMSFYIVKMTIKI